MVDSLVSTAAAGAAAGLGVAMPLGAVGVLLLQEGGRGLRLGASAATAVALVDLLYAAVAVLVGPRLAGLLGGGEAWVRLGAGVVLAAIAVRGLLSLSGGSVPGGAGASGSGADGAGAAGPVVGAAAAGPGSARRSFLRFGVLTLVNPTTALYFTALTAARGAAAAGAATAAVFAGAVFVASLLWQQVLAAAGAFAGARLTVRTRRVTYALGYGLVLCFAVRLAWPTG
ncbi:hypothetical protein KNE206_61770 [Kitasatospora sp. NE20-6]|uniref:lysine transporter LysE n=1 Tax=Kitasatospora sp. NE20-6 TaxID=2859066 RepID=UPI0034DC5FFF